ncbi:MAG: hypothetical protein M1816_008051 [Peltula sp. TS41687]|nr:MAG: hypothetical protein M1816_008051 [Peltula sp. TS41687]
MAAINLSHFEWENVEGTAAALAEEHLTVRQSELGYGWILEGAAARLLPLRDLTMMRMIDKITDKVNWMVKREFPYIRAKWQQEFLTSEADISQSRVTRVLDELHDHASKMRYAEFSIGPSYLGVHKSDNVVSELERESLREHVKRLEDVPDKHKDWHPNSDQKILDLVDPSFH